MHRFQRVFVMSSSSSRFSDYASDPQVAQIKLPPHSLEAEQSLIGGILLDNQAWERVADLANEADFYRDDHRRIYRHITKLIDQGRPADVVTVFESLEKNGEAEQAGAWPTSPRLPTTPRQRQTSGVTPKSFVSGQSCANWSPWGMRLRRAR